MLENRVNEVLEFVKNGNNFGEPITVVGASKTMSAQVINEAISYGLKVVAENKVQEFREKNQLISPAASQHFIGHLQTNKVKYLVGGVSLIHSVESLHLAAEIDRVAKNKGVIQNVLIEINVGGELSKSGFSFENAKENVKTISSEYKNLCVKGLMAMMPMSSDEQFLTSLFKKMRTLYDDFNLDGYNFEHLSMGMSNDYKIAIENGSNMIRLGRTIFGERNYGGK